MKAMNTMNDQERIQEMQSIEEAIRQVGRGCVQQEALDRLAQLRLDWALRGYSTGEYPFLTPEKTKEHYGSITVYAYHNIGTPDRVIVEGGISCLSSDREPMYHAVENGTIYAFDARETFRHWLRFRHLPQPVD